MTWKELAIAILQMPASGLDDQAQVYPPGQCPAQNSVPIKELLIGHDAKAIISTGKLPK